MTWAGDAMPDYPPPNTAPYDLTYEHTGWLFDHDGRPFPIIARSRRRVTIAHYDTRVTLRRRHLETSGQATAADGSAFRVTRYQLPDKMEATP